MACATAWGAILDCNPHEAIGQAIVRFGIYDLVVSEALARLVDDTDICVDAGANIGYTALLMATRAQGGKVFAFEPHPRIAEILGRNIAGNASRTCEIELFACALGASPGDVTLTVPRNFATNWGLSRVAEGYASGISVRQETIERTVQASRIDMLKIDVEGAERGVLEGARTLLATAQIRDIIYEHNEGADDRTGPWLAELGYSVFELEKALLGPHLSTKSVARASNWEPQNRLATRDPQRALDRFHVRGWQALRRFR